MPRHVFNLLQILPLLFMNLLGPLSRADDTVLSTIAFGSCAKQDQPQPIWESIVAADPQVFLFIGDNIYGDAEDVDVLKEKWAQLGTQPGYQKIRQTCPVLAVWDDHDMGRNDAGAEYPLKQQSQQIFLDFFEEPQDSPRRHREGLYGSYFYGPEGKRVQIILLDTRYFRSPLIKYLVPAETGEGVRGPYDRNLDAGATVLGEAQWKWLEDELRKPAEVRIIASSIQVIADGHRWEKWGNFPLERQRLFELIRKTKANGCVLLSGDRHAAEISAIDDAVGYRLYDVTSSSLNARGTWNNELSLHRVGLKYFEVNFGTILIDWEQADPLLKLQVRDLGGNVVLQQRILLSELQRRDP